MKRDDLVSYLDNYLRIGEISDSSLNGLQVESPEDIRKIAFTVDASLASFVEAVSVKADILIVHHGIMWKEPVALTGPYYKRIKTLVNGNCGLYAAHLPLDLHPEIGNNAMIVKTLEIKNAVPFGTYHGIKIGFAGELPEPLSLESLSRKLSDATGAEPLGSIGKNLCRKVAAVSGGAADLLEEAALDGFDTFITGDAKHESFHLANEYGVNVLFAGHYATETFGVKALQNHLREKFKIETEFLNIPTGL